MRASNMVANVGAEIVLAQVRLLHQRQTVRLLVAGMQQRNAVLEIDSVCGRRLHLD